MKKQIFTLLTLLLCVCSGAWADDTYEYTHTPSLNTDNYFTAAKGANSVGTFTVSIEVTLANSTVSTVTKAVKMEDGTTISFSTSTASSTVYVGLYARNAVSSHTSNNQFKFDGDVYTATNATTAGSYELVQISSVGSGSHTITRNSKEVEVYYVKVVETGTVLTKLSTPEISYNSTNGTVTIGSVTNATKVTYTTDGSDPTAESDTYSDPFVVEDGTIVKAIAIGTGSYSNSDIASETVYMTGITCATPVIKKFNGAVAITSTTPNATIKFSTNGGLTYNTYARPFILAADATIMAKAERENCTTSTIASEDVAVVTPNKTKTIYLDYDDFNNNTTNSATGKTGTDADGYTLAITGNTSKNWSSNNVKITTPAGIKREFKLSNGAQNTLTIPAGVHVTRLTLYSIINSADKSIICGWKEVGDDDYQTGDNNYKNVPMGAYNNLADYNTNPDVRVYDIDQTGGTITFTNAGAQLSFVLALDILEDNATITPAKEYTTYVTPAALDFTGLELKAYVATAASNSEVTMVPVTTVPAGTPLILKKGSAASYDVPVAASATAPATNLLKASDGVSTIGGDGVWDYILSNGKFYHASAGVLPAGKCYLHLDSAPGARELSMNFGDDTTALTLVNSEKSTVNNEYFDLLGRKVAQPTRGLYIVNGKKIIIK